MWEAIFPPSDPNWAWRRRMAFAGCVVFLAGIVRAIAFDMPTEKMSVILSFCVPGFSGTLLTYMGIATANDHLKRETDRKAAEAASDH